MPLSDIFEFIGIALWFIPLVFLFGSSWDRTEIKRIRRELCEKGLVDCDEVESANFWLNANVLFPVYKFTEIGHQRHNQLVKDVNRNNRNIVISWLVAAIFGIAFSYFDS